MDDRARAMVARTDLADIRNIREAKLNEIAVLESRIAEAWRSFLTLVAAFDAFEKRTTGAANAFANRQHDFQTRRGRQLTTEDILEMRRSK